MRDITESVIVVTLFLMAVAGLVCVAYAARDTDSPILLVGGFLGYTCLAGLCDCYRWAGKEDTRKAMRELRRALNSIAADSKVDYRHRKAIADIITKYEEL